MAGKSSYKIAVELSAVIVGVREGQPVVFTGSGKRGQPPALPSGPFETRHRTLEQGLRAWAQEQGGIELGYVEQLYTFADKDRGTIRGERAVSIGYLALIRDALDAAPSWYSFFPWEDRRNGVPEPLTSQILEGLKAWKAKEKDTSAKRVLAERIATTFPADPRAWNEELVLQRYELLWDAGLIAESPHGRNTQLCHGAAMAHDHRRILATGIARLRAKIKYRPVVFELLPDRFTLLELQNTVEALAGVPVHKQNFRRLVLSLGLVEEARGTRHESRGRPARLYTFRREILRERAAAGTKLPRAGG